MQMSCIVVCRVCARAGFTIFMECKNAHSLEMSSVTNVVKFVENRLVSKTSIVNKAYIGIIMFRVISDIGGGACYAHHRILVIRKAASQCSALVGYIALKAFTRVSESCVNQMCKDQIVKMAFKLSCSVGNMGQ